MQKHFWVSLVAVASMVSINAFAKAPAGSVSFKNVKDGASIPNGSMIQFEVKGLKIVPAGKLEEGAGHHHLIIDRGSIPEGQVIPTDDNHLHFGKGQTEVQLKTTPGPHALTLQFADGVHRSYGPALSATIHVTVTEK